MITSIRTTSTTTNDLDPFAARVKALETILTEKGLIDPAAVDAIVETYEHKVGPRNGRPRGGQGLVRSGVCPDWLARDATAAIRLARLHRPPGRAHAGGVQQPKTPTISSSARSAPATRWTVFGVPPVWLQGAALLPQPGVIKIRAGCWPSSDWCCPEATASGCGFHRRTALKHGGGRCRPVEDGRSE